MSINFTSVAQTKGTLGTLLKLLATVLEINIIFLLFFVDILVLFH